MVSTRRKFLGFATGLALGTLFYEKCQPSPGKKVLIIGIDGLRPDALQAAVTPTIDSLINDGAYSLKAQAGEHTVSYPGWSNIFTGVWEDKHGIVHNPVENDEPDFNQPHFEQYPSFFTRAKEYNPYLTLVSLDSWETINDVVIRTMDKNIHHAYDLFHDKVDAKIAVTARDILSDEDPDLTFVYFVNVDGAGHGYGYGPGIPQYMKTIEDTDYYVKKILEAQRSRTFYEQEHWLTMIISDHGGIGHGHGGQSEEEKTIPFIMHGPSVKRGEIIPAPTQVDIAPTVLTHLGIPVKKEWNLDGKAVGLNEEYI